MSDIISLLAIQVGRVRSYDGDRGAWTSAIAKESITGVVQVGVTGLVGDQQADPVNHGGPDKAVLGYASEHYALWQQELPEIGFSYGAFGENLTFAGVDESTCCLGDVVEIGGCRLEVSQPRQPCWKLSAKWGVPTLTAQVFKTGRTGWYYRVLTPGQIEPGAAVRLVARPYPQFAVSWCSSVLYAKPRDHAACRQLAACSALSESWRSELQRRAAGE